MLALRETIVIVRLSKYKLVKTLFRYVDLCSDRANGYIRERALITSPACFFPKNKARDTFRKLRFIFPNTFFGVQLRRTYFDLLDTTVSFFELTRIYPVMLDSVRKINWLRWFNASQSLK